MESFLCPTRIRLIAVRRELFDDARFRSELDSRSGADDSRCGPTRHPSTKLGLRLVSQKGSLPAALVGFDVSVTQLWRRGSNGDGGAEISVQGPRMDRSRRPRD